MGMPERFDQDFEEVLGNPVEDEHQYAWEIAHRVHEFMVKYHDMNYDQFAYLCGRLGVDQDEFR